MADRNRQTLTDEQQREREADLAAMRARKAGGGQSARNRQRDLVASLGNAASGNDRRVR